MGALSAISPVSALTAAQQIAALTVDLGFSTTVAGKTYNAGVTYSAGEYVADDPTLSGASATGTSVQAAEDNLISRIDELV